MSREVVRTVEAVPTFKVMHRYADETAAGVPPSRRNIRLPRDPYWFHG